MDAQAPPRPRSLLRRFVERRIVSPLVLSQAPPHQISRGAGLGLFVALLPIVGQLYLTPALWAMCRPLSLLRFNLPVAMGMVLLINPPLKVPLFYGYLLSGEALLGAAGFDRGSGSVDFRGALEAWADAPWSEWLAQAGRLIAWAIERYALPLGVGGIAWAAVLGGGAWAVTAYALTRGLHKVNKGD